MSCETCFASKLKVNITDLRPICVMFFKFLLIGFQMKIIMLICGFGLNVIYEGLYSVRS